MGPGAHTESDNLHTLRVGIETPVQRAESAGHLLREVMCRAAGFKVRKLICPSIALAADLDGTFAVARMQPVSRGAVQIAAVVAAQN